MGTLNLFRRRCILRITEAYDTEQTRAMEKGDVVLPRAQAKKLLPHMISEFTRSPYSHVEIYIGDGWVVSAEGVGLTLADHVNHEFVDVMRLKGGLTREQRAVIMEKALHSLAKPYEFLLLGGFPFWGPKSAARRAANEAYICSEHACWCYKEAGIDLVPGRPESVAAPADVAHSDRLEWIGAWYEGKQVVDAKHHEDHRFQGQPNSLARFLIRTMFDPNSLKDEYYEALSKKQSQLMSASTE